MPNPISHAEMIAALQRRIDYLDDVIRSGYELAAVERHAMQAVLLHLERTQWRPIEEAPKMKTIILFAVTDTDGERVTNWKMATGFWHTGADCWEWEGRQVRKYDPQPTHFMPLPPSPETPR